MLRPRPTGRTPRGSRPGVAGSEGHGSHCPCAARRPQTPTRPRAPPPTRPLLAVRRQLPAARMPRGVCPGVKGSEGYGSRHLCAKRRPQTPAHLRVPSAMRPLAAVRSQPPATRAPRRMPRGVRPGVAGSESPGNRFPCATRLSAAVRSRVLMTRMPQGMCPGVVGSESFGSHCPCAVRQLQAPVQPWFPPAMRQLAAGRSQPPATRTLWRR
mmetsp:Transcript_102257/g.305300  ORF Transcript_102257/g.305300 Transcript_102257/m.305300 type:complete len:212 (-) Transcript_102257:521-1156(-)